MQNRILIFLQEYLDKIPFITFVIMLSFVLHFNELIIFFLLSLTSVFLFYGIHDWRENKSDARRWCLEFTSTNILKKASHRPVVQKIIKHLARHTSSNYFEISKRDLCEHMAIAILFLSVYCIKQGNVFSNIIYCSFVLIMWSFLGSLNYLFYLRNKILFLNIDNYQECFLNFYKKFYIRTIVVFASAVLVFYISYNFKSIVFFTCLLFVFLSKSIRIYNEILFSKINLQKNSFSLFLTKPFYLQLESAKIWRDIAVNTEDPKSTRSHVKKESLREKVHPLLRLVMFRTMFDFNNKNLFLISIPYLDAIVALLFYLNT